MIMDIIIGELREINPAERESLAGHDLPGGLCPDDIDYIDEAGFCFIVTDCGDICAAHIKI